MGKVRSAERQEFLADLVTTALEGGIGYWSAAEEYRWFSPTLEGGTAEPGPNGTANAYAVIVPADEESDDDAWPKDDKGESRARIDVDGMARALGIMRRGESGVADYIVKPLLLADRTNGEEGDFDAEGADCLAQLAVFGKVIFG